MKELSDKIEFTQGYRYDLVVFARSATPGLVVTNLPISSVPADKLALCANVAEIALLAASWQNGYTLRYLGESGSLDRLRDVGEKFGDEFLAPLVSPDVTVQYEAHEVRAWLQRETWWRRSVEDQPGTEYA